MCDRNCSYEEAVRINYDENWRLNIVHRFDLETSCMTSLVLTLLGRIRTDDFAKVVIYCVDEEVKEGITVGSRICQVYYSLDYKTFFEKSDYKKKKITLKIIKETFKKITYDKGLDYEPYKEVFDKILELDYVNTGIFKKKPKSPNKMYTAVMTFEHDVKDIKIYISIKNKLGETIVKKLILTTPPSVYTYVEHVDKLIWVSDNEVQLLNYQGKIVGSVNI